MEKRTFKVYGQECLVTAFDVLPNGYFVIADRKRGGWLYIFDTANRMLCKLFAASSDNSVLDLAALTDQWFAYIDKIDTRVIHFVEIGDRYRHMERQDRKQMDLNCRRIYCFDEQIFIVCSQPLQHNSSTILVMNFGITKDISRVECKETSRIQCPYFYINALTYHCNVDTGNVYIYVTDIVKGIRCYENKNGRFTAVSPDYRDIDVQWYYGITSDKWGKVFVCTQDEFGPEIYELELGENNLIKVVDMKLHLTESNGLETPTTIRYHQYLKQFIVGSFEEISFKKSLYGECGDPFGDGFQSMRGRHDSEGYDRQTHAQNKSTCSCTTLGIYRLRDVRECQTPRATATPSHVVFDDNTEPERLIPVGKMSFKVDDVECSVSGFDILPRGVSDILPSGKIALADNVRKQICIFGPSDTPRNILHCKMRVNRYKVLDVATLTDRRLVFVADNRNAIYIVVAGKRFRHMEIEKNERTNWNGRRMCYFDDKLYIVGMDDMKTKCFIEIFIVDGLMNLQPVMTLDCGDFPSVTSIAVNDSYIFVTSVSAGIRVYDHAGQLLTKHYRDGTYRDIDVQWYYGIAKDKYDNWFVCTQDELGPEIYYIKVEDNGKRLSLQLTGKEKTCSSVSNYNELPEPLLRITAEEGLEPPLTLGYHPRLDLLMVGSNHISKQNEGLGKFRQDTPSRDPKLIEQEARERFTLTDASWHTTDCDLYKIKYKSTRAVKSRLSLL